MERLLFGTSLFLLLCNVYDAVSSGSSIRLFNTLASNQSIVTKGSVQVNVSGVWKAICDDGWDAIDALVACRELGLTDGYAMLYSSYQPQDYSDRYSYLSRPKVSQPTDEYFQGTDFACKGDEESLLSCKYTKKYYTRCSRKAKIACGITETKYNEILASLMDDGDYYQPYSVLPLSDASSEATSGLVLFKHPQAVPDNSDTSDGVILTGGVCDMDDRAAMLLCDQHGYNNGGKKAKVPTIDGLAMTVSKITCDETTSSLFHCERPLTSTGICPNRIQYNGVICYSIAPPSVIGALLFAAVASLFILIVGACSVHRIRKDRKLSRVYLNMSDEVASEEEIPARSESE